MTEQIVAQEPPSAEQLPDENHKPEKQRSNWRATGIFITSLALVIFVGGFGYGYYELTKINLSLAHQVSAADAKATDNQTAIAKLQQNITDLQQETQKTKDLSAQQEQLMSEWRAAQQGDLNKWQIAEAQYLVKLANDHLQFTHNMTLAAVLLQSADQVLQKVQGNDVLDIRKSIAADLANLRAKPEVDVTTIYLRLNGLDSQLDQLPLPVNPLKPDGTPVAAAVLPEGTPWWKVGLQRSIETLRKIVIVRYNNSTTLPLVLPDEKAFLYQNLHAQLEGAMWGLLHRNAGVYEISLTQSISWIKAYFVQDAPATKAMVDSLTEMQKINIQTPAFDVSATLALFDSYLAAQKNNQTNATPSQ